MDHVVHTQLKLYSTSWLQSFEALFHILGTSKVAFCMLEGSQVGGLTIITDKYSAGTYSFI